MISRSGKCGDRSKTLGGGFRRPPGDVESGSGVPIALPLPDLNDESRPSSQSNRVSRFCSQAVQGSPPKPYKRPRSNLSPDNSEEFTMSPTLPMRKNSFMEANSYEEQNESSELPTKTEPSARSDDHTSCADASTVGLLDSQSSHMECGNTPAPSQDLLVLSRHTVETVQGAPRVPSRRSSGILSLGSLSSMDLSESDEGDDGDEEIPGLSMLSHGST